MMGKSSEPENNCQKYGVPFYGLSWVPKPAIRSITADGSQPEQQQHYIVAAGGGGEGRSGIPNAFIVSRFDFETNSLSDHPVEKLGTGDDLPYRIAVHPGSDGIVCSFPKSCRWYEWDAKEDNDIHRLGLKESEKMLDHLEGVGQQLAITFSNDGSMLGVGSENGTLRVFKWPSMEMILEKDNVHTSVKDLNFSLDGKFLVSVGSGGPARVWDLASLSPTPLTKENDEVLGFCRFSNTTDNNQVLYVTTNRDSDGRIVKWNTTSWTRMSSKLIVRDPISAFDVSADGKLLAVGTIQGDVLILNSANLRLRNIVKKAHLGIVTSLAFSEDSRALASASMDSSARVTLITEGKKKGMSPLIILLILLVAVAIYYSKFRGGLQ